MNPVFLTSANDFLHCEISSLPFKYLGFLVGSRPHFESTWDPLISLLEKRLNSLKDKYVWLIFPRLIRTMCVNLKLMGKGG